MIISIIRWGLKLLIPSHICRTVDIRQWMNHFISHLAGMWLLIFTCLCNCCYDTTNCVYKGFPVAIYKGFPVGINYVTRGVVSLNHYLKGLVILNHYLNQWWFIVNCIMGSNFRDSLITRKDFSLLKMKLKMSSAKWQPRSSFWYTYFLKMFLQWSRRIYQQIYNGIKCETI